MIKATRVNRFCALIIMLIFCVLFIQRTPVLSFYAEKFNQLKASIESRFATPPKEAFLKQSFYNYLRTTNRKNVNGVTIMNNGHFILERAPNPPLLSARADAVIELNNYFADKGVPFLFLKVPCKIRDYSSMPSYSENTVLEDSKLFMSALQEKGVDTLDLRNAMISESMDFATAFYKGDHHWTSETAFWAFGKVGTFLNSRYSLGLNEKRWNPNEYDFIIYKEASVGGLSTLLGDQKFKEDITAIVPKFSTSFEITRKDTDENEDEITTIGDFVNVFTPAVNREDSEYFFYSDLNVVVGDPFIQYKNALEKNNKRVLLISDSFGWPLATYMAVAFENLDYFYLTTADKNKIFYEEIGNQEYDIVIFFVYEGVISNTGDNIENDRMYLGESPQ